MEPITQGLLGAAVARASVGRSLGPRALGWGALIGMAPDLDVLAAPLHAGFGELVYHRGTTHALWFGPAVGPLLGWCLWKWRDGTPERLRAWIWLCVLVLVTHPLLDVFTPYGTQFFAPFWRARFAWNGVGIIDPLYTLLLALGLLAGWVTPRLATRAALAALAVSSLYLGYGVWLNERAERDLRQAIAAEGISGASVRVYPTVFQPWLRRFVARTDAEVRVGLYTPWRRNDAWWESFPTPPEDPRVDELLSTWEGRTFRWFAMDEITWRVRAGPERGTAIVEVDDLRYGFPGDAPERGFWGVRAVYDASGRRRGPVARYAQRRGGRIGPVLSAMWRATWGDFSAFAGPVEPGSPKPSAGGEADGDVPDP